MRIPARSGLNGRERARMVEEVAAALHDDWRAGRALPEGGFEPRLKPDGLGGHVDIANTSYHDLPQAWQAENRAAARFAVELLLSTPGAGLDELAAQVHQDWLSRNAEHAEPGQLADWENLDEGQRQKDRDVVMVAWTVVGRRERRHDLAP